MTVEWSDAQLVGQIEAGDRTAEAEFFHRMAPRIRLYGLRHLRDAHAADDLTQQVLITTLEALRAGRLREPEKLASFVFGTCRMTVLDQRRNAQRKERLLEQFGPDLPVPAPAADPMVDREHLARCVQNLRERERTVIVMTFYDEQTGADLARFLGISEANVRVIRHRAIHQLRDCMERSHERFAPDRCRRSGGILAGDAGRV
jgi:RNA polymerase sigma-70 factor (ECF subfamily)